MESGHHTAFQARLAKYTAISVQDIASIADDVHSIGAGNATIATQTTWKSTSSLGSLNRSIVLVLVWILASNRSHIVHDQPLPLPHAARLARQEQPAHSSLPAGARQGDAPDYLKFRFVQGSPDKERRFADELARLATSGTAPDDATSGTARNDATPTLFAWHGSSMDNWHSIIRTGLDFETKANGRAFGDGVYLSRHMATSRGYAGYSQRLTHSWLNLVCLEPAVSPNVPSETTH